MHREIRSSIVQCALMFLAGAAPAAAQDEGPWFVRLGGSATEFGAAVAAEEPAPGEAPEIGPGGGVRVGGGIGRRLGPVELAVDGSWGEHGLRARGGEGPRVSVDPGYELIEVTATAAYPVLRTDRGARLQLFAGPSVGFWSGAAVVDSRTTWGGVGGLELIAPVTRWLALDARATIGASGSPNGTEETEGLDSTYEPVTLWSRALQLTLRASF